MPFGYSPRGRGVWRRAYGVLHALVGAPAFLRRIQWPTVRDALRVGRDEIVLDIGCGDLQMTAELAKTRTAAVIGVDPSSRLGSLRYVSDRFPRLRLVRADGRKLPLADATVDRILVSSVLQMIPDPQGLLAECRRVLKPNGRLVLTVPTDYRYLPRLFQERGSIARRALGSLLGLPREYGAFLLALDAMFKVGGAGRLPVAVVHRLLEDASLHPVAQYRVPGRLGTLIWEGCIAISFRLRDGRVPMLMAFVFYPIALVDRLTRRGNVGCELVVVAEKTSPE